MKKVMNVLKSRLLIVVILIAIQLSILLLAIAFLNVYYVYFYALMEFLSIVLAINIVNKNTNPMFKLAWIIPMLIFPLFGGIFYLFLGRGALSNKIRAKLNEAHAESDGILPEDEGIYEDLRAIDPRVARQSEYLRFTSKSPLYRNTQSEYLSPGDVFFKRLISELRKAEKFIFLEYFIIKKGYMWDTILDILKEKAANGVDVRIIYDDFGTIGSLERNYNKKLEEYGIKVCIFNPIKPSIDVHINYRDHRKICVIDGYIGFTGGINIADEYINKKDRFGYWMDSAIVIYGDAVNKLTIMFLQIWHFTTGIAPEYEDYLVNKPYPSDGYVQPFNDEPLDDYHVCELSHMNMINIATDYIYITTPYLIIDHEMQTALTLASDSGVDVRIITPHIPDKKLVHMTTRANYRPLIESGVKIYEYEPGFLHSKSIVVDDELGIVGTTNFDYRSFYLHFENGIWLYRTKSVQQIKDDYLKILDECKEITLEFCDKIPLPVRLLSSIIKLFSPLM